MADTTYDLSACCSACITPGTSCTNCATGTTPAKQRVRLSGVANGIDCATCASLNGIDIDCVQDGTDPCQWLLANVGSCIPGIGRPTATVVVRVTSAAGHYFLGVDVQWELGRTFRFIKDLGTSKPDCHFSAEPVPYDSGSVQLCDGTGATCLVTAV